MSATKVLRRMLDERGVEHEDDEDVTRFFGPDGFEVVMQEDIDGKLDCLTPLYLTPEQAIAATLGQAVRHPKPHEKWTTVLLPDIAWSWDDRWPDYLSVAHDTHGEWRTYVPEATLGAGSCKRVMDSSEHRRLKAENAKLRELVADMLSEDMDQHWPEFTRRARELGVEVD